MYGQLSPGGGGGGGGGRGLLAARLPFSDRTGERLGVLCAWCLKRFWLLYRYRIRWDAELDQTQFTVGYLDRFLGTLELTFSKFDFGTIVQHRIQYVKYKGIIVWDKRGKTRKDRVDNVFGSLGACLLGNVGEHAQCARLPPLTAHAQRSTLNAQRSTHTLNDHAHATMALRVERERER